MRFPSIRYVYEEASRAFRRFPLPVINCVIAWSFAAWMIQEEISDPDFTKTLLTLTMGIFLFVALSVMLERPPLGRPLRPLWVHTSGLVFLALFLWALVTNQGASYSIRYTHWLIITLLTVSFAAHLVRGAGNAFWQFNRRLVQRTALSGLYTMVFFTGLSIALAAIDELLGVDIQHKAYAQLWAFAGYVFFPWHLLAGLPQDFSGLATDRDYPKPLRIFTQYMLVPITTIYFGILYIYMGKILITRVWPGGWVSWLTIAASFLCILTFLLLFPFREEEQNRWIRSYSKVFCIAAIPLLFMLYIAIYKRVSQYGLTEGRYFLVVLSAWFLLLFLYFIFKKEPDLRRVPLSMALLAVVVSFGPWGVYDVSLRSQKERFLGLLSSNGLLKDGKVTKTDHEVSYEDRRQISACLDYLVEYHGAIRLQPYFEKDLTSGQDRRENYRRWSDKPKEMMEEMGLVYVTQWEKSPGEGKPYVSYSIDMNIVVIGGYDLLVPFSARYSAQKAAEKKVYEVIHNRGIQVLWLLKKGNKVLEIPVKNIIEKLEREHPEGSDDIPLERMTIMVSSGGLKAKVILRNIGLEWGKETKAYRLSGADGYILLKGQ